MTPRVKLYTRRECHLCEPARAAVARACEQAGENWIEIDVDADAGARTQFTDKIPVVTVDGEVHGYWTIDAERVRRALR